MNIIKTEKGYYYKIYKNNKKKRVSKIEYEKYVKKGGNPNLRLNFFNRKSPTTIVNINNLTFNKIIQKQYQNNNRLKNIENQVINKLEYNQIKNKGVNHSNTSSQHKNKKIKINQNNINQNIIKTYRRDKIETTIINKKNNKQIIKIFKCHQDLLNEIKKILNEIIMHKYAIILTDEYNEKNSNFKFKVPKIINITYYLNPNNEMIEISITMEKLNKIEKKCDELNDVTIYNNIISYLEFLRSNGLFHNDTHPDNLFFIDDKDYKMGLIDFGQSNTKSLYSSFLGIKIKNNTNNHNTKINKLQAWCKKINQNKWSETY